MKMKCSNCGAELLAGSTVCFECGAAQQASTSRAPVNTTAEESASTTSYEVKKIKCHNCGAELAEGSTVCFECGSPQSTVSTSSSSGAQAPAGGKPKSKFLAAILSFIWGAYGIDQFYLGYTKTGITRIVVSAVTFCIGGAIWGIIDCFKILNDTIDKDAKGNPLV